jgi:hypothetical protein
MQTKKSTIVLCFYVNMKLYSINILLVFCIAYANACHLKWFYSNMGLELKVNIVFAFNHLLSSGPLPSFQTPCQWCQKWQYEIHLLLTTDFYTQVHEMSLVPRKKTSHANVTFSRILCFFLLEYLSSFWRVGFLLVTWEWPVSLKKGRHRLTWVHALKASLCCWVYYVLIDW